MFGGISRTCHTCKVEFFKKIVIFMKKIQLPSQGTEAATYVFFKNDVLTNFAKFTGKHL